jgi:hypothetical protein
MKTTKFLLLFAFQFVIAGFVAAQQKDSLIYKTDKDIAYRAEIGKPADEYAKSRCKLDIYYPVNKKKFATIVWFHGGNLVAGEKYIPEELKNKGIAIVAVNYRLSPKAQHPAYIDDAAAAVAWTFQNISKYGGDSTLIFVSGHSAGGFLTLMLGLDNRWLSVYNIDNNRIAGLFPISGQTITHCTIRKEMGLPDDIPFADQFAPVNHVHNGIPFTVIITGDRRQEIPARYEENALLQAYLVAFGNKNVSIYELAGFNHNTAVGPACYLIINQLTEHLKEFR